MFRYIGFCGPNHNLSSRALPRAPSPRPQGTWWRLTPPRARPTVNRKRGAGGAGPERGTVPRRRPCSQSAGGVVRAIAPVGRVRSLVCAALACLLAGPVAGASAHRFKHVCSAAPRGRAACTAERLLLGAEPQPTRQAATARLHAARGRHSGRHRAVSNRKPYEGFLTPERLHAAYGLPDETAAGSTQTIALVDAFNDPTAEADLAVYDQQFGLPECTTANGCFTKLNQEGKPSPLPH